MCATPTEERLTVDGTTLTVPVTVSPPPRFFYDPDTGNVVFNGDDVL